MSATSALEPTAQPVLQRIRMLRRHLRRWVVVDGLARVVLAALVLAVLDMLVDRTFKMDLSQRVIMLVLAGMVLVAIFYLRVIRPLMNYPSDDALVLEVERKNPDRGQSLISGFQLARETVPGRRGMSDTLVRATIEEGNQRAQAIDFGQTLNRPAAQRNQFLLLGGLLICAAIGVGAAFHPFLQTWFQRNVLLADRSWPQATYLQIAGAVDGVLKIDRGADHDLRVLVTEDSRVRDVTVDVELETGTKRSSQQATATGRLDGREHQLVLRNVSSEFRLRAVGGDAITPWVEVQLVEPIDVRGLTLTAELPAYAGPAQPLQGSGPHSVLVGSRLRVELESNLPVATARLKWNEEAAGDAEHAPASDASIALPAVDATHFAVTLPDGQVHQELKGGKYSIELIGSDGRKNYKPISFQIAIADDKPPKVAASLSGIGGLVVPRAQIPISFKATDRYGLTRTSVDYLWKANEEAAEPQTGAACPRSLSTEDVVWGAAEQEFSFAANEMFDLRPLSIPPGEVLRFSVAALDNQPGETGIGRSREFLLRIVTEEELRADLLRREIEQRAMLQQERTHQLQLLTDLRALAASPRPADEVQTAEQQQMLIDFQNRQKNIGTNLFQIAERFSEFLAEAKNNRLDESEEALANQIEGQNQIIVSLQTRYADRIITPIRELDASEIYLSAQALEEARGQLSQAAQFADTAEQTAQLQEIIIRKMDEVLAAMEDSQTYQEIVNQVIALKRLEQSLIDSINTKQGKTGQGDIFDNPKPDSPEPRDPDSDDDSGG